MQPGIKWELDEQKGKGVFIASNPVEKMRTAKTFVHKVLYEATKEHPAQIEKWEEMKNVGKYTVTHWSGMVTPLEKSVILGRLDTLIRAVKKARQRANCQEVQKLSIGKVLFDFINGK